MDNKINFFDQAILNFVKAYKFFAVVITFFVFISFVYGFLILTPIFQSKASLELREPKSGASGVPAAGQSSGLSALLGATIGQSMGSTSSVGSLDELKTRTNSIEFTMEFLRNSGVGHNLIKSSVEIDEESFQNYIKSKSPYGLFKSLQSKCKIGSDKKTNLVVMTCDDKDPVIASKLLSGLISYLNESYRDRESKETLENIEFLKSSLLEPQSSYVRARLLGILETELQKNMIAFTAEEYKLKTIDPPDAYFPKYKPQRSIILALGGILGIISSMLLSILFNRNLQVLPAYLHPAIKWLLGHDNKTS